MINKSNYTLSFTVRASKMNKAGKAPIEVLIAVGDERTVFSTGKLVALENWNKDKQCVRGTNSEAVGKSSVSCPLKPSDSAPLKHSTMPP